MAGWHWVLTLVPDCPKDLTSVCQVFALKAINVWFPLVSGKLPTLQNTSCSPLEFFQFILFFPLFLSYCLRTYFILELGLFLEILHLVDHSDSWGLRPTRMGLALLQRGLWWISSVFLYRGCWTRTERHLHLSLWHQSIGTPSECLIV